MHGSGSRPATGTTFALSQCRWPPAAARPSVRAVCPHGPSLRLCVCPHRPSVRLSVAVVSAPSVCHLSPGLPMEQLYGRWRLSARRLPRPPALVPRPPSLSQLATPRCGPHYSVTPRCGPCRVQRVTRCEHRPGRGLGARASVGGGTPASRGSLCAGRAWPAPAAGESAPHPALPARRRLAVAERRADRRIGPPPPERIVPPPAGRFHFSTGTGVDAGWGFIRRFIRV